MPLDQLAFATALARLLESEGEAALAALAEALRSGVPFDHWLAAAFRRDSPPLLLAGGGLEEPEPPYHAGPYLLDPFYRCFREERFGWAAMSEIAPAGFGASDYMATYYRKLGVGHELGFLSPLLGGGAFHLAITRSRGAPAFGARERAWLAGLSPLLAAAGRRVAPPAATDPAGAGLHASLTRAFESFGSSVLTDREGEVVRLLLQGHLPKAIARRLGISPGTARNHLKRIYPKLGVASHAELYALFLRALRVADGEGDPLLRMAR